LRNNRGDIMKKLLVIALAAVAVLLVCVQYISTADA
jgi:hypothetical protein